MKYLAIFTDWGTSFSESQLLTNLGIYEWSFSSSFIIGIICDISYLSREGPRNEASVNEQNDTMLCLKAYKPRNLTRALALFLTFTVLFEQLYPSISIYFSRLARLQI